MLVISTLRNLRQEEHEFKVSLAHIQKYLNKSEMQNVSLIKRSL